MSEHHKCSYCSSEVIVPEEAFGHSHTPKGWGFSSRSCGCSTSRAGWELAPSSLQPGCDCIPNFPQLRLAPSQNGLDLMNHSVTSQILPVSGCHHPRTDWI